jgi:hypothetical protein
MNIKNNLFDQMENIDDGKIYAVNISLKSGEVIYLESLSKSEKDAYIAYVKSGTDVMLLEMGKTIWRIQPSDIEKLDVKSYSSTHEVGIYPIMKVLMAKSRMESSTFTRFITLFIGVFVLALIGVLAKSLIDGEIMNVLFDSVIRNSYLELGFEWIGLSFKVIVILMLFANIVDLILKPVEAFHIIDHDRHFLAGTKTLHVLITFGFVVGYSVFMNIFTKLLDALL